MRIEKVSIGRADVHARRGERAAAQDLLPDKPLVVVFVELGFESGIRGVIRSRPFTHIHNHVLTSVSALAQRVSANRDVPHDTVLKMVAAYIVCLIISHVNS